jgi:hypothetical protein
MEIFRAWAVTSGFSGMGNDIEICRPSQLAQHVTCARTHIDKHRPSLVVDISSLLQLHITRLFEAFSGVFRRLFYDPIGLT